MSDEDRTMTGWMAMACAVAGTALIVGVLLVSPGRGRSEETGRLVVEEAAAFEPAADAAPVVAAVQRPRPRKAPQAPAPVAAPLPPGAPAADAAPEPVQVPRPSPPPPPVPPVRSPDARVAVPVPPLPAASPRPPVPQPAPVPVGAARATVDVPVAPSAVPAPGVPGIRALPATPPAPPAPRVRSRGSDGGTVTASGPGSVACPPTEPRTRSASIDNGNGVRRVEWSDASCSVAVWMEGDVGFNEDFTAFASVSPGGFVRITESGGDVDRRLEIRPGAGGALQYAYRLSGGEAAFDAAAQSWLRGLILEMLRTSGIAAPQRAAWLYRTQGADGVLEEVTRVRSDRAQRLYLEALLTRARNDPAVVSRALRVAGAELKSDRELADLLGSVSSDQLSNASIRGAYLEATGTIESDRSLGDVLVGLMDRESLSADDLQFLLETALSIESDREMADLLERVMEEHAIEGVIRDPFMRAMGTIESDREYSRVAAELLRSGAGG